MVEDELEQDQYDARDVPLQQGQCRPQLGVLPQDLSEEAGDGILVVEVLVLVAPSSPCFATTTTAASGFKTCISCRLSRRRTQGNLHNPGPLFRPARDSSRLGHRRNLGVLGRYGHWRLRSSSSVVMVVMQVPEAAAAAAASDLGGISAAPSARPRSLEEALKKGLVKLFL